MDQGYCFLCWISSVLKKFINLVHTLDLVCLGNFLEFQMGTDKANSLNRSEWKSWPFKS